jgi:hypothetical protein
MVEFNIGAAFDLITGMDEKLGKMHKHMSKQTVPKPIRRRFGGSGTAAAGVVTNVQCFPICAEGRMWVIRKVGIFGSDTHTVVASTTADLFAGSTQDLNVGDFQGVFLSGVPVPTIKDFGNRHITLYAMDQVYALVTGAPAAQQLVVTGEADEYAIGDVEEMRVA